MIAATLKMFAFYLAYYLTFACGNTPTSWTERDPDVGWFPVCGDDYGNPIKAR